MLTHVLNFLPEACEEQIERLDRQLVAENCFGPVILAPSPDMPGHAKIVRWTREEAVVSWIIPLELLTNPARVAELSLFVDAFLQV